jgi:tetratricopeptide (TPR) repeat protein
MLRRRIDLAASGTGGLILVSGDPGIGKTRLAEEAARYARDRGVRVLWGSCWEGEGAPAFWPWMQAVRSYAKESTSKAMEIALGSGAADIVRVMPELVEYCPGGADASAAADSDQARFRFFDSFALFLARLAAVNPVLVVLDDLHCADHGSLLLLQFLSGAIADTAILIVAAYRDLAPHPDLPMLAILATVSRKSGTDKIALGGLCQAEIQALLHAVGAAEPSGPIVRTLMERTDGNPFFLRELIALLTEGGSLLNAHVGHQGTVPLTVRVVINRLLASLSANCTATLRVASVIGREFETDLLLGATGGVFQEVGRLLDEALAAKIVQPAGVMRYRFKHALVRETIYESLPTAMRARIHFSVAEAIERLGCMEREATLSMLAHHAARALPCGTVEKALDCALRAGQEARRRLAYEEAVEQYQRALELGGSRISARAHCDLLLSLGEAQARAGLWLDARGTFERAAAEARMIANPADFARAAIGFKGDYGGTVPQDEAAISLLREAMSWLDEDQGALQVRVLCALTSALYFSRSPTEIDDYSIRAVEIAERINDPTLRSLALDARLVSLVRPTHLTEMLETGSRVLGMFIAAGDKPMEFRTRLIRYLGFLEMGDLDASACEFERAVSLAGELRDPRCLWQTTLIRSSRALAAGDFEESSRLSESAFAVGQGVHDSLPTHYFLQQRFHQDRMRGTLQGWEGIADAGVAQYPGVSGYRVAQAGIWGAIGQTERARGALAVLAADEFRDIPCDALFLWTLSVLAEVCSTCGVEWCVSLYERMLPFCDHNVVALWGLVFDGSVSHFLGMLSDALGRFDEGAFHLETALRMNTKMGAPPLVARTQFHYAQLLLRRRDAGDTERALDLLGEARATMERTGQVGYLSRVRELLAGVEAGSGSDDRTEQPTRAVAAVPREYVFRREAEFWTLAFDGEILRIKDRRGLAYLACLLRTPGRDIHVLDLIMGVGGMAATGEVVGAVEDDGTLPHALTVGDAGPIADVRAREQYRRRLAEIDAELAEAEAFNDLGRTPRLQLEREELTAELKRAFGLNGRSRVAKSPVERARISVRNRIASAIKRIGGGHPGLRRHLETAIRTGTYCSYRPERVVPWTF